MHRQAAYLHLKETCMKNYWQQATPDDIWVSDELRQHLAVLMEFGVNLPEDTDTA